MHRWLPVLAAFAAACDCRTSVEQKTYVCATDDHCVAGYVCRGGVCQPEGATAGGGVAGGGASAGGGGGEAGGGGTAGGGTAGGGTAGGGTAGGGTAGGGTAGGGTAGGGTAGGGTAGGGTAGGGATPPDNLIFTTTPPSPLPSGTCFGATVQARTGTTPVVVSANAPIGLAISVTGGARFYADAACGTQIATTTILIGTSSATFFVKPVTGTMLMTITASASFGTAMQSITPLPVVRRGTCSFPAPVNPGDGGPSVETLQIDCPIIPPQTNPATAFALHGVSSPTSSAGTTLTDCFIVNATTLRCMRGIGTDTTSIGWQTVELPSGLAVQSFRGPCNGGLFSNLTLNPVVNPATTFILKATLSTGSGFDDEETTTARLMSNALARVETKGCTSYGVQVIDLSGLTVTHGIVDAGFPIGTSTVTIAGLPAASTNATVLTQARTTLGTLSTSVCVLLARGDVPSPTSVTISRGSIDGGCDTEPLDQVVWDRIDFGSRGRVQARTVTVPINQGTTDVTIAPVDVTRTFIFSSSQTLAGHAAGETTAVAELDEATWRFELVANTLVRLHRGDRDDAATLTFYVVELEP